MAIKTEQEVTRRGDTDFIGQSRMSEEVRLKLRAGEGWRARPAQSYRRTVLPEGSQEKGPRAGKSVGCSSRQAELRLQS